MLLRRELVIPSGFRRGRLLVRLGREGPDTLVLAAAQGPDDATHQLVNAGGVPFLTHLAERDPVISGELTNRNIWEAAESILLLSCARPGTTFLDVGANVGYYSALLARAIQKTGRVFAFEPEPENYLLLTANALLMKELYPETAPITPDCQALADRHGTAQLTLFDGNLGKHSLVHENAMGERSILVPTITLDALRVGQGGTPPVIDRRIDLLKADAQGSELMLLRGSEQTLERDRPLLCLEFEPHLSGDALCLELVDWLIGHGYSRFRLFHANHDEPYRIITELANYWTGEELGAFVRRKRIGPYGTLFAYPDVGPSSRC